MIDPPAAGMEDWEFN
jgi:hypothetical protein